MRDKRIHSLNGIILKTVTRITYPIHVTRHVFCILTHGQFYWVCPAGTTDHRVNYGGVGIQKDKWDTPSKTDSSTCRAHRRPSHPLPPPLEIAKPNIALALLFCVGTKEEKPARRDKWLKSTKSDHKPAISTCRISEKARCHKRLYHEQLADFRRTGPSLLKKRYNTWPPQANQLDRHSCLQNVPQGLDSVEDNKMAKIKSTERFAAGMLSTIRVGMACVHAHICSVGCRSLGMHFVASLEILNWFLWHFLSHCFL